MIFNVLRFGCKAAAMLPRVLSEASLTDAPCKPNKIDQHHHITTFSSKDFLTTIYHSIPLVYCFYKCNLIFVYITCDTTSQGFSPFSRHKVTFTPATQLARHKAINENNLLTLNVGSIKKLLTYYYKHIHILHNNFNKIRH